MYINDDPALDEIMDAYRKAKKAENTTTHNYEDLRKLQQLRAEVDYLRGRSGLGQHAMQAMKAQQQQAAAARSALYQSQCAMNEARINGQRFLWHERNQNLFGG